MRKNGLLKLSLLYILVLLLAFPVKAAIVFSDDFSGNLSNWSAVSGSWAIESGELSQNDDVTVWTSIVAGEESWTDCVVEAKVKLLTGGDSYAGILFRYSSGSAYWFGLRYATQTVQLDRWGIYMVSSASFSHIVDDWYTLRVEVSGNTIKGYVDGVLKISASNSELSNGKIGFSTARAHAHFDDISVDNPGSISPNGVPEFGVELPILMSIATAAYFLVKRRLTKNI